MVGEVSKPNYEASSAHGLLDNIQGLAAQTERCQLEALARSSLMLIDAKLMVIVIYDSARAGGSSLADLVRACFSVSRFSAQGFSRSERRFW
jgi:hypothetical protein